MIRHLYILEVILRFLFGDRLTEKPDYGTYVEYEDR